MINGQDERRQALRAAMERLPLAPEADVEGSLDVLQLGCYFSRVNQLPRMTASRAKNGTAKELEAFCKAARKLRSQIAAMHKDSLGALQRRDERHALAVDCDLQRMIERATAFLEQAPDAPAKTSPSRLCPEQTAQICAQVYEELTGKRSRLHGQSAGGFEKKGGPYFRFVRDVFEACGVDASAEHYARMAQEHRGEIGGSGGVSIRRVAKKGA
jgi:hypothetical protein